MNLSFMLFIVLQVFKLVTNLVNMAFYWHSKSTALMLSATNPVY